MAKHFIFDDPELLNIKCKSRNASNSKGAVFSRLVLRLKYITTQYILVLCPVQILTFRIQMSTLQSVAGLWLHTYDCHLDIYVTDMKSISRTSDILGGPFYWKWILFMSSPQFVLLCTAVCHMSAQHWGMIINGKQCYAFAALLMFKMMKSWRAVLS